LITSSRMMPRGLVYLTLAALAVLGSATTSRAFIQVSFSEDGGTPFVISSLSDTSFTVPNSGTPTGPTLLDFTTSGVLVTATSTTSQLTLQLNTGITATVPGHTLTIEATEVYQTPTPGPNYLLTASAGDTNDVALRGTHAFEGFATPGSVAFGQGTGAQITPSFSLGTGSNSHNTAQAAFTNDLLTTTLTSVTTITTTSGSGTGLVQTTDSTILSLPEPSSVVLVSLGALWVVGLARKHHRVRGRDRTDTETTSQESNSGGSPQ
jgi:hypothetical protein